MKIIFNNLEYTMSQDHQIDSETLESLHLVRQWLHEAHSGTLATLSRKPAIQGFPLGSIVPFCVDKIVNTCNSHTF